MKKSTILTIISILIILCVSLLFCNYKEHLDGDEIFSYTSSNSQLGGFVGANVSYNKFVDSTEINKALTLQKNEIFDIKTVYRNQKNDVHPPMYYALFHFFSIISIDHYTKWIGLGLNLIFFLVSLILVYKISREIINSKSKLVELLPVMFYGLSVGAVNTYTFIRMYMLFTMLSLALVYIIIKFNNVIKDNNTIYIYDVMLAFIVFSGFMTHYYFLIFAFLLCAYYFIYLLIKKNFNRLLHFSTSTIIGVVMGCIIFKPVFDHVFSGYRGVESTENLMDTNLLDHLLRLFPQLNNDLFMNSFYFVIIILITSIMIIIYKYRNKIKISINMKLVVMLSITSIIYFLVVTKMITLIFTRYIYNIYPLFVIIAFAIIYESIKTYKNKKVISIVLIFIFTFLNILNIINGKYVWLGDTKKQDIAKELKEYPYIYYKKSEYAITSHSEYIKEFNKYYITYKLNNEVLEDITTYVMENDIDKIVMYLPDNEEGKQFITNFISRTNLVIEKETDIGLVLSIN